MIDYNELKENSDNPPPPVLGSWNKIYGVVFFTLVIMITLFYLFTKAFE